VIDAANRSELERLVEDGTAPFCVVNTDEWGGYARVGELDRSHATVNHGDREWARDDDGDGVREVHCNTIEGVWAGLRNFLRPFRGVHKAYLGQYVAMFQWAYNLKEVTQEFLRFLLGVQAVT
jgi:transposase-like protein